MGRRFISFAGAATACVAMVLAPAPGAAGGGAVFEFDSDYYVAGDFVEARAVVGLSAADEGITGGLGDGPFYAYLIQSKVAQRPHDPEAGISLGKIQFGPVSQGQVEATISFVVPQVKPGSYIVETCNPGCKVQWIGDLVGGWFTVVASREEIPLRQLEDRLTERIRRLQGRLDLFRDRLVDVETQGNNAASDAELAVNSGRDLDASVRGLQAELARLRKDSGSVPLVHLAGWFVAGALAGLGLAALIARRRRRPELPPEPAQSDSSWVNEELWRPDGEPELVSSGRR